MVGVSSESGDDLAYSYFFTCATFSCFTFLLVFYLSPFLCNSLWRGYRHLSRADQLDFDSRTGSSLHATVVSVGSLYVLLFDEKLINPVWDNSQQGLVLCSIVLGYMVADMFLLCWYYDEIWDIAYIIHHLVIIFVETFVLLKQTASWFALYRHVSEMSTPFVNQRACLDAVGYGRHTRLFIANGIIMAGVFFFVRVLSIPIYYYKLYLIYTSGEYLRLGFVWHMLLYPGMVLDAMNVFWFYKIYLGAMKVLRGNTKDEVNGTQQKKQS